jgi:hypothetical protein
MLFRNLETFLRGLVIRQAECYNADLQPSQKLQCKEPLGNNAASNKLLDARRISYLLIKLACFRARVNAAVGRLLGYSDRK